MWIDLHMNHFRMPDVAKIYRARLLKKKTFALFSSANENGSIGDADA